MVRPPSGNKRNLGDKRLESQTHEAYMVKMPPQFHHKLEAET
jgi:hypothetical protein